MLCREALDNVLFEGLICCISIVGHMQATMISASTLHNFLQQKARFSSALPAPYRMNVVDTVASFRWYQEFSASSAVTECFRHLPGVLPTRHSEGASPCENGLSLLESRYGSKQSHVLYDDLGRSAAAS